MRYLTLLLFVFSFFSLNAQNCPPGDVIITSQQEMDDFVANFPNCTTINGDLTIQQDVTDLTGLSSLTNITGSLVVHFTQYLSSLTGLEQIDTIGENLAFEALWSGIILDISALDHPIYIGGIVFFGDIYNNSVFPCTIQPICDVYNQNPNNVVSTYETCLWDLQVSCNPPTGDCPPDDLHIDSYSDISFFTTYYPNCTVINGNLTFDNGVLGVQTDVTDNFANIQRINGSLSIWDTELVGAFIALDTIMGSISVSGQSIEGLDAELRADFPVLKYIGGGIGVGGSESGYIAPGIFPVLERIEGGIGSCYPWGNPFPLTDFPSLKYIGGSITTDYANVSGLNAVDTIMGSIDFRSCYYNSVIVEITGLNQLKYIGGDMVFGDQHCLRNLSGLTELNSIGGDLGITFQTNFACGNSTDSLTGLAQLQHVGDDLILFESNLSNLDFLSQLQSVGDSLYIRANSFDNLDALNHPISIGGELIISQNWNLSECAVQAVCDHLNSNAPTTIGGNLSGCNSSFEIQALCDPMLLCPSGDITLKTQAEIDGFFTVYTNCTELPGRLIISAENPADVNSLEALSQLTSLGNGLIIDNTAITNLSGLQNLTTTGYNIVITNNSNLISLEGLENISATSSHLKIENNNALTDLSGLNNITQIGESLLIFDNDNLQNLSGLNALTSIGSQLYLKNNINMTSLSGLENLNSIGTDIRIQGNTSLGSLSALSNVANISGYIQLTNNDALTSLMGLENINPDGITQITVMNNPNLSMCSASSICGHIEDDGSTTFSNNAAGCNSLTEVTDICTVSTHSPHDALNIAIFPNPNNGTFTIQGIINATYNIRSFTGQIIQSGELKNDTNIDISNEAQGVYFVSISIDNQVITKRIVKM